MANQRVLLFGPARLFLDSLFLAKSRSGVFHKFSRFKACWWTGSLERCRRRALEKLNFFEIFFLMTATHFGWNVMKSLKRIGWIFTEKLAVRGRDLYADVVRKRKFYLWSEECAQIIVAECVLNASDFFFGWKWSADVVSAFKSADRNALVTWRLAIRYVWWKISWQRAFASQGNH